MRALSLLAAAAMIVSLFLPWLASSVPGSGIVPWDVVRGIGPDMGAIGDFLSSAPPLLLAFIATFVLAGLFLALGIVGLPLQVLALAAGGLSVAITAYTLWTARDEAAGLGLPIPANLDVGQILDLARNILGAGAWAWGVGALVLLLAGLTGFGRR